MNDGGTVTATTKRVSRPNDSWYRLANGRAEHWVVEYEVPDGGGHPINAEYVRWVGAQARWTDIPAAHYQLGVPDGER